MAGSLSLSWPAVGQDYTTAAAASTSTAWTTCRTWSGGANRTSLPAPCVGGSCLFLFQKRCSFCHGCDEDPGRGVRTTHGADRTSRPAVPGKKKLPYAAAAPARFISLPLPAAASFRRRFLLGHNWAGKRSHEQRSGRLYPPGRNRRHPGSIP